MIIKLTTITTSNDYSISKNVSQILKYLINFIVD